MSEHKEHHKRRHHKNDKDRSDKSKSHSSSSSSSDSDCEDFDELYCYYKKHLLQDPSLMVAGSNAFTNIYNQEIQEIPINAPVRFDITSVNLNTDHPTAAGSVFVREPGTYLILYGIETNEPSQFAVYVNNVLVPNTVVGTDTGSGQLLGRTIQPLKRDDAVIVRNHLSAVAGGSVHIPQFAGGSATQANVQLVLYKIAPHPCDWYTPRSKGKVSGHKKDLYCKLERKLLCDPELQLEGFDAYGTFFTQAPQTVAIEAAVTLDQHDEVKCIQHVLGSSDIIIEKAGVYTIFAISATNQVAQMALFVNGGALPQSVVGTNKGGGQLSSRVLVELKKGDVVTWRNHTSATPLTLSVNPGGTLAANNTIVQLTKIAPLCSPYYKCTPKRDPCCPDPVYCEPDKVRDFKEWLLCNRHLQIQGASALLGIRTTTPQAINVGEPLIWKIKLIDRNVGYIQGEEKVWICQDGEYDILTDIISNQPDQFAIFVNGKPVNTTITGQDTGSARLSLRAILPLCKGDYVTFVNWKSSVNPVVTTLNSGGSEVGLNAGFLMYRLGPQLRHDSPKKK
jgi:hypothetical protein